jgi:NADH dehydrogenase
MVFLQKVMVAEDEWLPMFNKVNGTENICYMILVFNLLMAVFLMDIHKVQVAIQQGLNLAKNFKLAQKEKTLIPFKYNDKGRWRL